MNDLERKTKAPLLRIYVAPYCESCQEALRLADAVRQKYAGVEVEVVDLGDAESQNSDDVFSVPTYLLNGKVISLGNPSLVDLERWFGLLKP